jgi:hypothetical protein
MIGDIIRYTIVGVMIVLTIAWIVTMYIQGDD